jgi:hypothetical protein
MICHQITTRKSAYIGRMMSYRHPEVPQEGEMPSVVQETPWENVLLLVIFMFLMLAAAGAFVTCILLIDLYFGRVSLLEWGIAFASTVILALLGFGTWQLVLRSLKRRIRKMEETTE